MLRELVGPRLAIPSDPPWHVTRRRLLTALDRAAGVPLTLLSAGPGAGKTVLLAEWARRRRGHVAWLCPAPDDNEPARFRALLTSALPVPPAQSPGGPADFAYWLREQMPDRRTPFVLAVDDAHVLTCPEIADLLDKLVRYGSPRLHVVLAARHDPPLPLHRYRLAGQMRELRTADLTMTHGEIQDVLAAHHVTLPGLAVSALAARTEGWAAGVGLTAMRMEHAPAPHRLVDELSFGYGSVGEYFTAEVLPRLPEPGRRLLIETSFLDEVTAPLAEAITDLDDAGRILADLVRGNWFVTALDPAGTRFRYHRLFAEVLRYLLRRDGKRGLPELAARAAAYFERDGDHERALYWSARAGDPRHVATLLVRGGLADAFAHQRDLPSEELSAVLPMASAGAATAGTAGTAAGSAGPHADIALAATVLRAATADPGAAALELERAALDARSPEIQPVDCVRQTAGLVELMLGLRSSDLGVVDGAASRLLSGWPPSALGGAVLLAQASAHFWHGVQDDVDALLSQALIQARRSATVRLQAEALAMMACVDAYRSRARHEHDAALQVHRLIRGHPGLRTPPALRLAAAVRSMQRADLAAAARQLRHASVPAAVSADQGLAAAFTLWRASLLALSGQPHEAHALLDAEPARFSPPLLQAHRDILRGEIETSLGRPQGALKFFEPHHRGRLAALVDVPYARAYLALDDLQSARQSIRSALSVTGGQLSRYVLVESMLLESRIACRSDDTGRALEMMTNALDVAHAELTLPFVLARGAFGELLARHPALASRWPSPPATAPWDADGPWKATAQEDVGTPWNARTPWNATGTAAIRRVGTCPIELTQREASVLAYLPTSMAAAEVADELYLSVNTVKTHLAAIYRKLGAHGRREAVRRARELGLL